MFWQDDYFDRYIRDEDHYRRVVRYIENNPVKAGLVPLAAEWPWGSAHFRVRRAFRRKISCTRRRIAYRTSHVEDGPNSIQLVRRSRRGRDGPKQQVYGDLFRGAPEFFDRVLMNPPFGGKEGREAQTKFDYKTGATQVLFLQHALKNVKKGSRCAIVLDEGLAK